MSEGAGVFRGEGGRGGAGGRGGFLLRGGEGGKRGGVGAEGFRGGADAEDFNRDGVVLADQGERIQTPDSTAEDGMEVVEALGGREGEEEFAAVGVRAGVGHGEDAGGVMAEAGDKFVGEVGRDGRGERIGVLETRVAALDDEAGDDAIPREAGVEGFPVFCSECAFGEAGEVDAHERGLRVEELDGGGAAGGGEFGVEAVGERRRGRGLGGAEGCRGRENENDKENENEAERAGRHGSDGGRGAGERQGKFGGWGSVAGIKKHGRVDRAMKDDDGGGETAAPWRVRGGRSRCIRRGRTARRW